MVREQFQYVWKCKSLTFKPASLIELWKLFCNLLHVINHIRVACNHFCLGLSLCYNSHCAAEREMVPWITCDTWNYFYFSFCVITCRKHVFILHHNCAVLWTGKNSICKLNGLKLLKLLICPSYLLEKNCVNVQFHMLYFVCDCASVSIFTCAKYVNFL